jgi:hypothetical protein
MILFLRHRFSNCSYAFHVAKGDIFSLFLTYVVIGSSVAAVRGQSRPSDMDNDNRHCRHTGMACGAAMVPVPEVVESGRVREGGVWLVLAHCRLLSQTLLTCLILGLISHEHMMRFTMASWSSHSVLFVL